MSNPSFSNIDRWLFELYEGNLSPEQVQQLEVFLMQHPDLDIDKDMWELARVEKTEAVFPHQDKFIKRKPVGLFMMAGFASISIFIVIGINLFTSSYTKNNNLFLSGQTIEKTEEINTAKIPDERQSSKSGSSSFVFNDVAEQTSNRSTNFVPTGLANSAFRGEEGSTMSQSNLFADLVKDNDVIKSSNTMKEHPFSDEKNDLNDDIVKLKLTATTILKTHPVKEIDIPVSRNWNEAKNSKTVYRGSSIVNTGSFSSRLSKATRALSRMMDNPVALKNLKDPSFSLPGMLPMDVNFGNTGTIPATRIQTLTRVQWPNLENQQLINQLAFDSYVYAIRGGIGAQVNHSFYGNGEIMNSMLALTYSPKISVNRNVLIEPSLRFKMGNKMLDPEKIDGFGLAEMDRENVQEFYPTGTTPIGQQLWYRDLGLGMMVNTKWFFIGVQGDNLFKHYDNIYSGEAASQRRVGQHFIATIGTDYESKRELIGLSPYLVYQQREDLKELWMGVNTRLNWFTMGLAVSDRLDGVASAGIKFEQFSFNYQADLTHSALWDKQILSHQLNIKFTTFNSNKKQKFINL